MTALLVSTVLPRELVNRFKRDNVTSTTTMCRSKLERASGRAAIQSASVSKTARSAVENRRTNDHLIRSAFRKASSMLECRRSLKIPSGSGDQLTKRKASRAARFKRPSGRLVRELAAGDSPTGSRIITMTVLWKSKSCSAN